MLPSFLLKLECFAPFAWNPCTTGLRHENKFIKQSQRKKKPAFYTEFNQFVKVSSNFCFDSITLIYWLVLMARSHWCSFRSFMVRYPLRSFPLIHVLLVNYGVGQREARSRCCSFVNRTIYLWTWDVKRDEIIILRQPSFG